MSSEQTPSFGGRLFRFQPVLQVMTFTVGWKGMTFWLVGVLVLAALASALPAWRAVRLMVRDVLAYE